MRFGPVVLSLARRYGWTLAIVASTTATFVSDFDWKSRLGNALATALGAYGLYLLKQVHINVRNYFADRRRRDVEHDGMFRWYCQAVIARHNPRHVKREEPPEIEQL